VSPQRQPEVGKILTFKYLKYKNTNTGEIVFEIPKYQILYREYLKYQIANTILKY